MYTHTARRGLPSADFRAPPKSPRRVKIPGNTKIQYEHPLEYSNSNSNSSHWCSPRKYKNTISQFI